MSHLLDNDDVLLLTAIGTAKIERTPSSAPYMTSDTSPKITRAHLKEYHNLMILSWLLTVPPKHWKESWQELKTCKTGFAAVAINEDTVKAAAKETPPRNLYNDVI
ncbi:hypothetical protein K503DRAFT_802095 [Rhizopogon vinicolor AM-OR11-026]|uniref:Uncharacterized protein n=1 Tax=Rhizopogon vinicolor AM-OR11-026 TaxID=1314800 RepID=A0A1B7MUV5_9AGAM|nr:hypothetical protein K503DRAFT_802095 [Rhizopogon vinicolor AM-OR11-026]